jgi:HAD superfamily hydrolase (TIGR01490 family)
MDPTFSDDRSTVRAAVAFFDLDKTLSGEISGKALVIMAWKRRLLSLSDLMNALFQYILLKSRLREPEKIIYEIVGRVRGRSVAQLDELCELVLAEVVLPSLFSDARKEINYHKDNGAKVIILSSSLLSICRAVSEKLGMDGYFCSDLEQKDGSLTGRPSGKLCYGDEKLNRLTAYCIANSIDHTNIWYYSDSISDLPVLSAVGNPVCVNPDRQLKKEALKRGWKILKWED